MIESLHDSLTLLNGMKIPSIGFGTWQTPDGDIAVNAVKYALEVGYRHIDTAAAYGNEESVNKAIRESDIPREELFITTKLWNSDRGYAKTLNAFEDSMKKLGVDYLDLYLIHWPSNKKDGDKVNADTWKAFEKLYRDGQIKAIGVSNFLVHHLESLMESAEIEPMINQIEFHPGQMQSEVLEFCRKHAILIEGWSPLGTGRMLENPQLKEIAGNYRKSVAQLCIRWALQHEVLPLPKSVTPSRIAENMQVFDFEISESDMKTIDDMPYFGGSGLDPDKVKF